MKPPAWIDAKLVEIKDGHPVFLVRARCWHPGFWLALLRMRKAMAKTWQ